MKKLALLLALVFALIPVLVACDKGNNETETETETETEFVPEELAFADVYNTDYAEDGIATVTEGKLLESLLNCIFSYSENGLLVFRGTNSEAGKVKFAIYNTKTSEVVYKLTYEAPDADIVTTAYVDTYNGVTFIFEEKTQTSLVDGSTTTTYALLDATGKELATKNDKEFNILSLSNGLLAIDGKVYSTKNDTLTALFDLGMKEIPDCDVLTDVYNYCIDYDVALVYDQKFDLVTYVKADSNADDTTFYVLNDGNILIVNEYQLLDDAEEYDYALGVEKYNVDHYIFNIETQQSTYVELDFIIREIANTYADGEYFTQVFVEGALENLAVISPIIDKTVDFSYTSVELVNLNNELAVVGILPDVIPNQIGGANLVADNRFMVANVAGQCFLVDETGKVIGEITGDMSDELPYEYADIFAFLLIDEFGNVYDYDLNKLFNPEDYDYDSEFGLLFQDDTDNFHLLTRTGFVALNINESVVQNRYQVGDAICFYTYEEVEPGTYANYVTLINEAGAPVLKIKTGTTYSDTGSVSVYIDDINATEAGIVVTVRTESYDNTTYEYTTTYKTYFCADVAA